MLNLKLKVEWNNLPNICRHDIEIKCLILFLSQEYKIVNDSKYSDCRDNLYITDYIKNFLEKALVNISFKNRMSLCSNELELSQDISKKELVRILLKEFQDEIDAEILLIYFSGLYRANLEYNEKLISFELCDDTNDSFMLAKGNYANMNIDNPLRSYEFILKSSERLAIIEKLYFKGISTLKIENHLGKRDHNINMVLKGVQFESLVLSESMSSISWFTNISIEQFHRNIIVKNSTLPNVDFVNNSYTQEHGYIFENSTLKEIKLIAHLRKIQFRNTELEKLKCNDRLFISLPYFDDKSSIKHSVDIDKATFDNLLKVKQSGSLEFSRLAEFFNRNNAYIEAQQLHRHYLLAKAKESKSCGLKFWIWFYNLVNGCGTSLLRPFLLLTLIFSLNCNIYFYLVKITGVDVYYKAVDNILPFAAILIKNDSISNLGVVLSLKIISILATLLWFLIALQIRKLLKLKE
ncbi:hypothetical protein [Francisella sp. LA112445]|uniref:hypothetical protein n=1 Tax=Francisella sp. LA112445 TaxID=1395624 RepID=UPI001788B319|nr:hypothetical protein [Francisella sp. LA112445]QIW09397.1 hypothetical protein FIP56_01340 [Francisella sp. LA112445]